MSTTTTTRDVEGADERGRAEVLAWLDDPDVDRSIRYRADGTWVPLTYHELARRAGGIADALVERGAGPGDVVAVSFRDVERFYPALFGVLLAGATASVLAPPKPTLSPSAYEAQMSAVLAVARPRVVLTEDRCVEAMSAAAAGGACATDVLVLEPEPADPVARPAASTAILQFTSGSTGLPSGVPVSWSQLAANTAALRSWLELGPGDAGASWLPLHHDMGLVGTMAFLRGQHDLWNLRPEEFLRKPVSWLECMANGGTVTTAPSFGYRYVVDRVRPRDLEGMDLSGWRVAVCGAERVDFDVLRRFAELTAPHGFDPRAFAPAYGLAEATLIVSGFDLARRPVAVDVPAERFATASVGRADRVELDDPVGAGAAVVSCGRPVDGTAVEIHGDDGPVDEAVIGEIVVRGPGVGIGYAGAPSLATSLGVDGALRTGDAGFLLDGELYVVGRMGDRLTVRGTNVYAEYLEGLLNGVDGLASRRCVVVPPLPGDPADVVLVVEGSSDTGLTDAERVLSDATGGGMVGIRHVRRGAVPMTSSGKPKRRALWQQLVSSPTDASDGTDSTAAERNHV